MPEEIQTSHSNSRTWSPAPYTESEGAHAVVCLRVPLKLGSFRVSLGVSSLYSKNVGITFKHPC